MVSSGLAPAERFPRPGSDVVRRSGGATVRDGRSSAQPRRLSLTAASTAAAGRAWDRSALPSSGARSRLARGIRSRSGGGADCKKLRYHGGDEPASAHTGKDSFATRLLLRRVAAA